MRAAAWALQHLNAVARSDDRRRGEPEEEPVLDDARHVRDVARQRGRVDPLGPRAVEDAVALIGDERAAGVDAQLRFPSQVAKQTLHDRQRERDHLDRERRALAEPAHELRLVGDDHHPPGGRRDHLLAQVRASQPLDQVERRVDLVGAVDHEVELGDVLEREERDPQLVAPRGRRSGGGHAGDVGEGARSEPLAQRIEHLRGGRAAAQAQPHPRADEAVDGRGAGLGLERLEVGHAAIASATASASVSGARQANRSQMYTAGRPSTSPLPSRSGTPAAPVPSPNA